MSVPDQRPARPRLLPTTVTLLVLAGLMALGFWQLDRARQKEDLLTAFDRNASAAPLVVDAGIRSLDGLRYRRAIVRGRLLGEQQFLLDNQVHAHRAGYHVLTPLELTDQKAVVLVNRGWVELGDSRQELPRIPAPTEELELVGRLNRPPKVGLRLGASWDGNTEWPRVMPYLDLDTVAAGLGRTVLPFILLLDPQQPHGYVREWKIVAGDPERNRGYAFQWFAMATAVAIIYLVLTLRGGRARRSHD